MSRSSSLPVVAPALAWLALLAPSSARAGDWHLDAALLTDVPVDVAVRARLEGPLRLRLSTSLGVLPGAYVGIINEVSVSAGWYNQATADLIRAALESSLVWRTHVGWRPFPRHGFHFGVGYGLVALGGSATGQELVTAATGRTPPAGTMASAASYDVASTLHMLDVEVGWEFRFLRDRLALDVGLGFAGTVASSTTVTPRYQPRFPQAAETFSRESAAYLDETYQSYVFTPTITVAAGYRFF